MEKKFTFASFLKGGKKAEIRKRYNAEIKAKRNDIKKLKKQSRNSDETEFFSSKAYIDSRIKMDEIDIKSTKRRRRRELKHQRWVEKREKKYEAKAKKLEKQLEKNRKKYSARYNRKVALINTKYILMRDGTIGKIIASMLHIVAAGFETALFAFGSSLGFFNKLMGMVDFYNEIADGRVWVHILAAVLGAVIIYIGLSFTKELILNTLNHVFVVVFAMLFMTAAEQNSILATSAFNFSPEYLGKFAGVFILVLLCYLSMYYPLRLLYTNLYMKKSSSIVDNFNTSLEKYKSQGNDKSDGKFFAFFTSGIAGWEINAKIYGTIFALSLLVTVVWINIYRITGAAHWGWTCLLIIFPNTVTNIAQNITRLDSKKNAHSSILDSAKDILMMAFENVPAFKLGVLELVKKAI